MHIGRATVKHFYRVHDSASFVQFPKQNRGAQKKMILADKKVKESFNIRKIMRTFAHVLKHVCFSGHITLIIKYMYFTLFITVIVTAIVLVAGAYVVAKLIGPRSYNKVKGEPYESGIPTRGSSWIPVSIGF